MFGQDKSARAKGFHALRVHFPKLIEARRSIIIHCFDGLHHSPLLFALLLAVHNYEHSLTSALQYIRRLGPVWPGYFGASVSATCVVGKIFRISETLEHMPDTHKADAL